MAPVWTADWAWGLALTALTLMFHITAVIAIGVQLARGRTAVEKRGKAPRGAMLLAITAIVAVGLVLALLHGLEAMIWAAAYLLLGAIGTLADAVLYSLGSLTTRGESGITLERQWRLMGAVESANGVLLFGISTAFLAALLTELLGWFRTGAHRS